MGWLAVGTTSWSILYTDTPSLCAATNRPAPARPVSLGESVTPTCTSESWNAGTCRFPTSCRYRHVCSNCGEQHPWTACRNPLPTFPEANTQQSDEPHLHTDRHCSSGSSSHIMHAQKIISYNVFLSVVIGSE